MPLGLRGGFTIHHRPVRVVGSPDRQYAAGAHPLGPAERPSSPTPIPPHPRTHSPRAMANSQGFLLVRWWPGRELNPRHADFQHSGVRQPARASRRAARDFSGTDPGGPSHRPYSEPRWVGRRGSARSPDPRQRVAPGRTELSPNFLPAQPFTSAESTPSAWPISTRRLSSVYRLAPWWEAMARCNASPARRPVAYWSAKRAAVWKSRRETGRT
jgi:hypothetical protein